MEVDAFSSDAIPVHLITQEAIEMYMNKLMPNGVLCVHTSNRHVNLVLPVLKICRGREVERLDEARQGWQTGSQYGSEMGGLQGRGWGRRRPRRQLRSAGGEWPFRLRVRAGGPQAGVFAALPPRS